MRSTGEGGGGFTWLLDAVEKKYSRKEKNAGKNPVQFT